MSTHPDPEMLSAYVDGQLDGAERDDLEQHLTGCSDCSSTVRAIRATLADMRALPAPVPSEQDSWRVRAAITKARKRPAQRYRLWVASASVAAAVIAVVVITTGKTTSPTGNTGKVFAPTEARGAAPIPTPEIISSDFSESSAKGLVFNTLAAPAASPNVPPGPSAAGDTASDTTTNAYSAALGRYTTQIQGCESKIFGGESMPTPFRYVVARYEKTPAFFLVYTVGSGDNAKLEMYVVQQKDCYIRLFLAPR